MRIIFIDESGFSRNWQSSITEQPYFVLSAVSLPAESLLSTYDEIRSRLSALGLAGFDIGKLGKGFEIKAHDLAGGTGYWRHHDPERNKVRDLVLESPSQYGGTAFVMVVDKAAHLGKYVDPADPYLMSIQFLFERIQVHLEESSEYGICIFDHNAVVQPSVAESATELMRDGSDVMYRSAFWEAPVIKKNTIDRIVEFGFGQSETSIGIQIADFFATMTNSYVRTGKPANCGWWAVMEKSLYRKGGTLRGWGYKEFP